MENGKGTFSSETEDESAKQKHIVRVTQNWDQLCWYFHSPSYTQALND
jgi:hypothetical protein